MLLDGPFSLRKLRLFPQEDPSPPSDFFWQGPDSKYSWFAAHLVSVTLFQCSVKSIIDNIEMNVHGCVLIKHYLSSLKFEFHIIFTGQKSVLLLFFQLFKKCSPGWVAWLVRVSSIHQKVSGSIPRQTPAGGREPDLALSRSSKLAARRSLQ